MAITLKVCGADCIRASRAARITRPAHQKTITPVSLQAGRYASTVSTPGFGASVGRAHTAQATGKAWTDFASGLKITA